MRRKEQASAGDKDVCEFVNQKSLIFARQQEYESPFENAIASYPFDRSIRIHRTAKAFVPSAPMC